MKSKNEFQTQIATAENFKYLMDQLKREAEKNRKMELSIKLSETLMIPGGFTAYYDYISSITEDQIECINVFCKVVLTRPLKFSDDADYLLHSTENFSEIVQLFLDKRDDQSLRILLTKLFYYLRRNQNDELFDFFFESLHSKSNDSDALLYIKLCEWQFYAEELLHMFSKYFKIFLYRFLFNDLSSVYVKEAIRLGGVTLNFPNIYSNFIEIEVPDISKILDIWGEESIPSSVIESALAVSFPDSGLVHYLNNSDKMCFSEEFKAIIKYKAITAPYDGSIWGRIVKIRFDEKTSSSLSPSTTDINDFAKNLRSQVPSDMAFGLFNIRKLIENDPRIKIDKNIANFIVSLLSHEDSYVYMNSIKACVAIGKKAPSLICVPLIQLIDNIPDSSLILRYIEVFDELLCFFKDRSSFAEWTKKASILFAKFSNYPLLEVRCSVINFYTNILINNPNSFLYHQEQIWDSFDLSHKNATENDIETEVLFQFIDAYLTLIIKMGRHKAKDSVLIELFCFLRRSYESNSSQVSLMAYNNLSLLDKIKDQN